jgi:hypothetical protein
VHRGRIGLLLVVLVAVSAFAVRADPHTPPRTIPVYLFAGQSNMVGASASTDDLPDAAPDLAAPQPRVLFFGPTDDRATRWLPLRPPTELSGSAYGPGFGPELSAAAALARAAGPIAIVRYARDGTNLYHDWDPARPDGLYRAMIERAKRALRDLTATTRARPHLAGFFWMQGEGDSYTRDHALAYRAHLTAFLADVRHDLDAPRLPVVLGRIAYISGPFSAIVRNAQTRVAQRDPRATIVETNDLEHDPASLVHLDTNGQIELGRRFARAMQSLTH